MTYQVDGVWIVLCFQGEGAVFIVDCSTLPLDAIQKVACIELYARLVSVHFQHTPTTLVLNSTKSNRDNTKNVDYRIRNQQISLNNLGTNPRTVVDKNHSRGACWACA